MPALLGAYALYVLLRRHMRFLTTRWHWPRIGAAVALMAVSGLVLWLPVQFLVQLVQTRLVEGIQHYPEILQSLENQARLLDERFGIHLLSPENVKGVSDWLLAEVRGLVTATLDTLLMIGALYFLLFFMLIDGQKMEEAFTEWMPLQAHNVVSLRKDLHELIFSNAVGIPMLALLQGCTGLLAYWVADVEDPWLWFAITCIGGLIPVVGVALAYVPLALITIAQGMPVKGVILFLYGSFVVGSVDNVARMWIQKWLGNTHPLVTFFGVIAGVKLFGFIGIIFGPILLSLFLLLLRLYSKEFGRHPTHS